MFTIMARLTCLKGYHRMIHCRIGEGTARALMAIVTIDFRAIVITRNMGKRIWIIRYIRHTRIACSMAPGILAAAHNSSMVGRCSSKRVSSMAHTTVLVRHSMRWRFAEGNVAVVTVHT